jgi:hypothetical protein
MQRTWMRTAIACTMLCLGAAGASLAGEEDPRIGTWELNVAKSSFDPGPAPRKQTLWYKAEGRELMALIQGIDADGKPISPDVGNLTIYFDGRDHPTPGPGYDASSWNRISPNEYVANRKKGGKVVLVSRNVVSADRKTLTITTKGTDENGHTVNNVRVYDRVGP